MNYQYHFLNRQIFSDIPLNFLQSTSFNNATDIVVCKKILSQGYYSHNVFTIGVNKVSTSEYMFVYFREALFYVKLKGSNQPDFIYYNPQTKVEKSLFWLIFQSTILPFLAYQWGVIPINVAGIINNGETILLAGKRGTGKSMLLNLLMQKNYTFFTDSFAGLFQSEDGTIKAYPNGPFIDNWETNYALIGQDMPANTLALRPNLPKYRTFIDIKQDHLPRKIKVIIFLESNPELTESEIVSLNSKESFTLLHTILYQPVLGKYANINQLVFEKFSGIIRHIQCYKLNRFMQLNQLNECCDLIINHFFTDGEL
jgi:hypothetical protein